MSNTLVRETINSPVQNLQHTAACVQATRVHIEANNEEDDDQMCTYTTIRERRLWEPSCGGSSQLHYHHARPIIEQARVSVTEDAGCVQAINWMKPITYKSQQLTKNFSLPCTGETGSFCRAKDHLNIMTLGDWYMTM